jgi:hypothetical protein
MFGTCKIKNNPLGSKLTKDEMRESCLTWWSCRSY